MADFEAVLRKTLEGLSDRTPATRHRLYKKARDTIRGKVADMESTLPSWMIEKQLANLEQAIANVEAHYDRLDDPFAKLAAIFDTQRPSTLLWEQASEGSSGRPEEAPVDQAVHVEPVSSWRKPAQDETERRQAPIFNEGPNFEVHAGRLAIIPSLPTDADIALQRKLHGRLRRLFRESEPQLAKADKYPELVNAAKEYLQLLQVDIQGLDVISLWAVGSSLLGFSFEYREQIVNRIHSDAIRRQTARNLDSMSRLHSAFIMGFTEARELVEKADEFMASQGVLEEVREPGSTLLEVLTTSINLVEPHTRRLYRPISDYVHEFGWSSSRTGYSAYLAVRNSIHALLNAVTADRRSGTEAAAAAKRSVFAGDANIEFERAALSVLQSYRPEILAFVNHSPEFRAYVESAFELLARSEGAAGRSRKLNVLEL